MYFLGKKDEPIVWIREPIANTGHHTIVVFPPNINSNVHIVMEGLGRSKWCPMVLDKEVKNASLVVILDTSGQSAVKISKHSPRLPKPLGWKCIIMMDALR